MPSYSGIFTLQAQMQAIAAGTWTGIPPSIGDAYQGGFYAGQISTAGNGIADYNLVVGPVASAESTLQWKTANSGTTGTSSVIDGPANSAAMNDASHPCAQFCEGLSIGGYTDWYMPAKNELEVCYYNLKPTTTSNNTTRGSNANAVPARAGNYTAGTPAQTTASAFITSTGAQAFTTADYWSSTQFTNPFVNYAWRQSFSYGYQVNAPKTQSNRVRAIRRVAV